MKGTCPPLPEELFSCCNEPLSSEEDLILRHENIFLAAVEAGVRERSEFWEFVNTVSAFLAKYDGDFVRYSRLIYFQSINTKVHDDDGTKTDQTIAVRLLFEKCGFFQEQESGSNPEKEFVVLEATTQDGKITRFAISEYQETATKLFWHFKDRIPTPF